ncbi:hypothetical protein ABLG96_14010 [Nakamurella sp. A5-74]|uniref:Type II toxin-antitoxin system VapC family toxin n=1 Tax=Nakamurella sp. A5-74 TaxID=3158264 RepID=A0AAU8DMC8_9ACTN
MTRYVIDSPTLLHVVDHELAIHPDHRLVAPQGIRSQALALLLTAVRSGERTEADALAAHERLTELKMRLLGDRVSRRTAWKLAREQQWDSLQDAEYLAVARLQADALISVDPAMAARCDGLVRIADLEALTRAQG